jgi:hypothetical protein
MAFSYDDSLSTNRDKMRFHLNDTVEGKGPKPANGNFSNDEIDALLSSEDTWRLAVAAGFEVLASAWSPQTSFSVVNGSFTRSDASKQYLAMAKDWRQKYGTSATAPNRPSSTAVVKVDYALDID